MTQTTYKTTCLAGLLMICHLYAVSGMAATPPDIPHIDYIIPVPNQAQAKDAATIWHDDFDRKPKSYAEGGTFLDDQVSYGGRGRSLHCLYEQGQRGKGGAKVFFGDAPIYQNKAARNKETFTDIYWRIYVRHQPGWQGSPAKMSRATSMVSGQWAQAMIAHVWSHQAFLTLDPVRCVKGDQILTRKYNDWEGMSWLGHTPVSTFPIHATEESGYWVLVESRAKLNTPGQNDGLNQLWIDGRLECERRDMNFRDRYTGHGINAVFLEAYWNDGSPVTQSRWYDHFVISTQPIGPVAGPANPTVVKTPYHGPGAAGKWQVEVASDYEGRDVVYQSKLLPPGDRMVVDNRYGAFVGKRAGQFRLADQQIHYLRVRQQSAEGVPSDWSRWHQGFRVQGKR